MDYAEQMSKTAVGTFTYMSPERIFGKAYDAKSDIWSFGIIMYELGTFSLIKQLEHFRIPNQDRISN